MKTFKYSIGSLMFFMAVCAFALWIAMPAKSIRITVSPKNKLALNGIEYANEAEFWGEFQKRVDYCDRWRIEPVAHIFVPQILGHPPAIDLVLSMSQFGVSETKVDFYDEKTGDLIEE